LRANAHKLESAANQYKNSKLKVIAGKLLCHSRITNDSDIEVEKIMSDVVELLELCQSAQRDLLQVV
jgi:DNA-binding ferritin-like protein (Dps family)